MNRRRRGRLKASSKQVAHLGWLGATMESAQCRLEALILASYAFVLA